MGRLQARCATWVRAAVRPHRSVFTGAVRRTLVFQRLLGTLTYAENRLHRWASDEENLRRAPPDSRCGWPCRPGAERTRLDLLQVASRLSARAWAALSDWPSPESEERSAQHGVAFPFRARDLLQGALRASARAQVQ